MPDASKASPSGPPLSVVNVKISEDEVRAALNGVLADAMRPICVGLALFYALISSWYVLDFATTPDLGQLVIVELRASVPAARGTLRRSRREWSRSVYVRRGWFARNRLLPALSHPVAALIGIVVIINCLVLIVLGADPRQTTN